MGWTNSTHFRHSGQYYRDRYNDGPPARVVPRHEDLLKDRCAQLIEARAQETRALKRGNRSDAEYRRITIGTWENWFLELDATNGGNI